MIFSNDGLKFTILDAIEFDYGHTDISMPPRNFSALSYRMSSDASLSCTDNELEVCGGSLTFFPAGVGYTRRCTHDRMLVIHLDVENYVGYTLESVMPKDTDVYSYFSRIVDVWTKRQAGYRYRANALLYEMMANLYCEYFVGANIPSVIEKAVKEIHARYTDSSLTVSELAAHAGVSEVYLRRVFREHFGVSPKQYVIDLRIEYAKSLLGIGDIPINEVATRAGFTEPKHFAVAFRKKTGYPPSKHEYTLKEKKSEA